MEHGGLNKLMSGRKVCTTPVYREINLTLEDEEVTLLIALQSYTEPSKAVVNESNIDSVTFKKGNRVSVYRLIKSVDFENKEAET